MTGNMGWKTQFVSENIVTDDAEIKEFTSYKQQQQDKTLW